MTIVKWSGYHKDDEINNSGGIERPVFLFNFVAGVCTCAGAVHSANFSEHFC